MTAGRETFRDSLSAVRSPASHSKRTTELVSEQLARATEAQVGVAVTDFYALMPSHSYIFAPTRETWPAASVNARVAPIEEDGESTKAAAWLDRHRPVEQLTWAPGEAMLIHDRVIEQGGWIERPGCQCFNLYRGPNIEPGDARRARAWLDHVERVYPAHASYIIRWLAHRVQRPGEKVNHALLLGGSQGIGKDTILEPVKHAIGPWNFQEVSPQQLLGRFNGFVKSVILRVSEARDLGDVDRFAFYDHLKVYTAAPPTVIRCDEKNLREHPVPNVCGVVITTNHKNDGIYLPADDRRHYVAWSDASGGDFDQGYYKEIYGWYSRGGNEHVATYLATVDLSDFDAKAPPEKTAAFWEIVDANRSPDDANLADAIDTLGRPKALTLPMLAAVAEGDFKTWLLDRRSSRQIPHRLEAADYVPVRNPDAKSDGLWRIDGHRRVVYVRRELALRERIEAATRLAP